MKFYKCNKCGNIIILLEDSGVIPVCCGETMNELKPLTKDVGQEKHLPVVTCKDGVVHVKVSTVAHPMEKEHYIKWILLETNKGKYIRYLNPTDKPEACFKLCDDEMMVAVYEYCNIHSLWGKAYEQEDYC